MGIIRRAIVTLTCAITLYSTIPTVYAWENGGRTKNVENPKYGTHDWIAENALIILESIHPDRVEWLRRNMKHYMLGTEAPDNQEIARRILGDERALCYGDPFAHHVYHDAHGEIIEGEDDAARRAQEEYDKALESLLNGNEQIAAFYMGAFSHYAGDMTNWAHVMGAESMHDPEAPLKHSEFESSVDATLKAKTYNNPDHTSTQFQKFIRFDGELEESTAYDTTATLALQSQIGEIYSCAQMAQYLPMGKNRDGSYVNCRQWSENYKTETGKALNRGINGIATILNKIWKEYEQHQRIQILTTQEDRITPTR